MTLCENTRLETFVKIKHNVLSMSNLGLKIFFDDFFNDDLMMGGIPYMELIGFNVYRRNSQKKAFLINLYLVSTFHCNSNISTDKNRKKMYFIQNNNFVQFLTLNIMIKNCLLQFA